MVEESEEEIEEEDEIIEEEESYGEEEIIEEEESYGEEEIIEEEEAEEEGDQSEVEEESKEDPPRVCQNVPGIVPDSCAAFECAIVKEVYDYSLTRVEAHNKRRRLHESTADLKINLDIACKAKEWSNHQASNNESINSCKILEDEPLDPHPEFSKTCIRRRYGPIPAGKRLMTYADVMRTPDQCRHAMREWEIIAL